MITVRHLLDRATSKLKTSARYRYPGWWKRRVERNAITNLPSANGERLNNLQCRLILFARLTDAAVLKGLGFFEVIKRLTSDN